MPKTNDIRIILRIIHFEKRQRSSKERFGCISTLKARRSGKKGWCVILDNRVGCFMNRFNFDSKALDLIRYRFIWVYIRSIMSILLNEKNSYRLIKINIKNSVLST